MKKLYKKPAAKKVNFQYSEVVAASGRCDQGWTKDTTRDPRILGSGCAKCSSEFIWIGFSSYEPQ